MASAAAATTARVKQIGREIKTLDQVQREARAAESYGPAVAALSKINALREDVARLKAQAAIEKEADPIKRIGLQRQLALAADSHVAAAKLAAVEANLVIELTRAGALRAQAELTDKDAAELMTIITDAVEEMDAVDLDLLEAACARRRAELG